MGSPYDGRWSEYREDAGGKPVLFLRGGGWARRDRCGTCGKGGDHDCSVPAVHLLAAPAVLACGARLPRSLAEVRPRIPGGQLPEVVTCAECVTSALGEWPAAPVHHELCDADTDHTGPCRCRCGSPAVYEDQGCAWHRSVRERGEAPAGRAVVFDWRDGAPEVSKKVDPAELDEMPSIDVSAYDRVYFAPGWQARLEARFGAKGDPDLPPEPLRGVPVGDRDALDAARWRELRAFMSPQTKPMKDWPSDAGVGRRAMELAGVDPRPGVAPFKFPRVSVSRADLGLPPLVHAAVEPRTGLPWLHDDAVDGTQCIDMRRLCAFDEGHEGECRPSWPQSSPEVPAEVSAPAANRLLDHFGVSTQMRQCESTLQPIQWRGHPLEGSPVVRCERIVGHAGDHRSPEGTTWTLESELEPGPEPGEPGPEPGPVGLTADEVAAAVRKALRAYDADKAAFRRELNDRLVERAVEGSPIREVDGFVEVGEDGEVRPLQFREPAYGDDDGFDRNDGRPGQRPADDGPASAWRAAWARLTGASTPRIGGSWEPGVAAISDTEPGPDYDPPTMALDQQAEQAYDRDDVLSELRSAHVAVTELTHGFRDLLYAVLGRDYADLVTRVGQSPATDVEDVRAVAGVLVGRLRRLAVQVAAAGDEAEGR